MNVELAEALGAVAVALISLAVVGVGIGFAAARAKLQGSKFAALAGASELVGESIQTALLGGGQGFLEHLKDYNGDGKISTEEFKRGMNEFWAAFKTDVPASVWKVFSKEQGGESAAKKVVLQRAEAMVRGHEAPGKK